MTDLSSSADVAQRDHLEASRNWLADVPKKGNAAKVRIMREGQETTV